MPMGPLLTCLALASPQQDSTSLRHATILVLALAGLFLLFFVGIVLISMWRRQAMCARELRQKTSEGASPDPWAEAGRRVEPFGVRPSPTHPRSSPENPESSDPPDTEPPDESPPKPRRPRP